jgi:hypothetical protein
MNTMRWRWALAMLVAVLVGLSTQGQAQRDDDDDDDDDERPSESRRFLSAPLLIEDQGSFFIGGIPKVTNYNASPTPTGTQPNQIIIGQMYVQFQVPAKRRRGAWPVIMVHGSTHTGACLESTPDGREGWAPYFVRKGIPVYVVDQAGRGRSGFDQSVLHEAEAMAMSGDITGATQLSPSFGRITSNGSWTAWFGHLVAPGTGTTSTDILTGELVQHGWPGFADPSDPAVHPHPAGYLPAYPIDAIDPAHYPDSRSGLASSLAPVLPFADAHLGPATNGPPAYYQLEYYKQLVPNAEVTLPGSVCPSCNPQAIAPASTWTPFNLALLVERLGGAIVATHSQSGIMGHHMTRILKERGHLNLLKGLVTIEGSCSLPNSGLTAADFDDIPYLALKGDYTGTSAVCVTTVTDINARRATRLGTAKADYVQLDDPSFRGDFNGTTHMMMLGTNHLEVADVILEWVDDNVRSNRRRGGDSDR